MQFFAETNVLVKHVLVRVNHITILLWYFTLRAVCTGVGVSSLDTQVNVGQGLKRRISSKVELSTLLKRVTLIAQVISIFFN